MPNLSDLTEKDFKQLLDDYFKEPAKRQQLTLEEANQLAQELNPHIDIPLMKEKTESKILVKVIIKVDTFLYDNLPNEFYDMVRSTKNGIDDKEAKRLAIRLAKLANKRIDIPYIPEQFEYLAIRFILSVLINAAREKVGFLKACKEVDINKIPRKKKAGKQDLEAMVA